MQQHLQYLAQALELARVRRGFCAPNPAVGALVVKDGKLLSSGYHWASGHPHAEVEALNQLTFEQAAGATLYITLEPCCHTDKQTPPCTELIIEKGIREVIYGFLDPNPAVCGNGVARLRNVGIECEYIPQQAIHDFYRSYAHWWQTQKPFVTAKLALSLDSKIAGPQGQPMGITGPQLQQFTHHQRKHADAILTSITTILHDDPQLNVRLSEDVIPKPIIILDSQLRLPLSARIFTTAAKIIVFHQPQVNELHLHQLQNMNVKCIAVPYGTHGLDLAEILNQLGKMGIHDLWVEAGGRLFQSFIEGKHAQRAIVYVGPKLLGKGATHAFSCEQDLLLNAQKIQWQVYGKDVVCEMEFHNESR